MEGITLREWKQMKWIGGCGNHVQIPQTSTPSQKSADVPRPGQMKAASGQEQESGNQKDHDGVGGQGSGADAVGLASCGEPLSGTVSRRLTATSSPPHRPRGSRQAAGMGHGLAVAGCGCGGGRERWPGLGLAGLIVGFRT